MNRICLSVCSALGLFLFGVTYFALREAEKNPYSSSNEELTADGAFEAPPKEAATIYVINRKPKEKSVTPNVMRSPQVSVQLASQESVVQPEECYFVQPVNCCEIPSLFGFASYHFGESLISTKNYSQVGFYYIPDLTESRWGTYFQVDGSFLENGTIAQETGVGIRHRDSKLNWVWGVNLFGDVRFTDITTFFQYGVGFELYTPCFDFHLNGYIPSGPSTRKSDLFSYDYGDSLGLTAFTEEYLYRGVDALVGKYFFFPRCITLYGAVGGYYLYDGIRDEIPGFQMRGEVWYRSYLFAGFLYTYDNTFRSRGEGRVGISIPLTEIFSCFNKGCCRGSYLNGLNGKQGPIPRLGAGCIPGRGSKYQTTNF